MKTIGTCLITTLLLLGLASFPAKAEVCSDGVCVDLFQSTGGLFATLTWDSTVKASPTGGGDIVGVGVAGVDPDTYPILLSAFESGGFGCSGGIAPSSGGGATHGATQSVSMACDFQNPDGSTWVITITITWVFDGNTAKWQIAEAKADARLIKAQFQNQVQ